MLIFAALYEMELVGAFFVTRAKENMVFEVIETNYNIDERTGLISDQTIVLTGVKSCGTLSYSIENGSLSGH